MKSGKLLTRLAALTLAASFLMSAASCSSKKNKDNSDGRSGEKISADSPWFNSRVFEFDIEIDKGRPVEYLTNYISGYDDRYVVIDSHGSYRNTAEKDPDWSKDISINTLTVIDRTVNDVVCRIDLSEYLGSAAGVSGIRLEDGKIILTIASFNSNYSLSYTEKYIDPATGQLLDTKDVEGTDASFIFNAYKIGDLKVETSMRMEDNDAACYLYIYRTDGTVDKVEIKEAGSFFLSIPFIIPVTETKWLVAVTAENGLRFFELDINSLVLTEGKAEDYAWLDMENYLSVLTGSEGKAYFNTSVGISKIDMMNRLVEEVFNYGWCGVNRNYLADMDIIDVSDDKVVFCGNSYYEENYYSSVQTSIKIVELTRADKNPHAGKTILELYAVGGTTDDIISDAILKFNDTNANYYIEVTDRYEVHDGNEEAYIKNDDEANLLMFNRNAELNNRLAMDIMNGEGPDILMNMSSYGQLNKSDYLADLTPYVGDLDSGKYFSNIIEAAKVDCKLYQLPITFSIEGIHTDAKYVGESGVGFTTEEYKDFISGALNGSDIITVGQAYYFAKLFNNMSDKFFADGKADFSSPEFAKLADFVKDNVQEKGREWESLAEADTFVYTNTGAIVEQNIKNPTALNVSYSGISGYIKNMAEVHFGTAFVGIPSADGRGPAAAPNVSVAISSQAENIDACGEFVKILLSDEIQTEYAMSDNFALNREAFRQGAKAAVEFYNGAGGDMLFGYDYWTGAQLGDRFTLDEDNIDELENIILSCSNMNSVDSAIDIILIEEMPAYFAGQKSLEDVVSVARDRAQKVLDERG